MILKKGGGGDSKHVGMLHSSILCENAFLSSEEVERDRNKMIGN
jgi:hypothetical protein